MEFPVNYIAAKLAEVALEDQKYMDKIRDETKERRGLLENKLKELKELIYIPSQTNIMLIKHKGKKLHEELLKRGILAAKMNVKGLNGLNYVRVTIKLQDENEELIKHLRKI